MTNRIPAEVFPPGEFLKEELEARGWTQGDLAEILGKSERVVSEIINGKRSLSPAMARGLADAFGTSAEFWLNLESAYQLARHRATEPSTLDVAKRASLYERFPVREMVRRRWILPSENAEVLETRILKFYRRDAIDKVPRAPHAARKAGTATLTSIQEAWLHRTWQIAETMQAGPFSLPDLKGAFDTLRSCLVTPSAIREVPTILKASGVRFLVVEALPASKLDGVCFWLDQLSPVVALSLRYDRIDHFWFTLLHELYHVRYGHARSEPIIDTELVGEGKAQGESQEVLANKDAMEFLIPAAAMEAFIARSRPVYSYREIEAFAKHIGVHPGIVVGRLQHRGELSYAQFRKALVNVRAIVTSCVPVDGWGYCPESIEWSVQGDVFK